MLEKTKLEMPTWLSLLTAATFISSIKIIAIIMRRNVAVTFIWHFRSGRE